MKRKDGIQSSLLLGSKRWFLADFKVAQNLRKRNLGALFLTLMIPWGWCKSPRMYSLVMGKKISEMKYLRWWSVLIQQFQIFFYMINISDLMTIEGLPLRYTNAKYVVNTKWTKKLIVNGSNVCFYHFVSNHFVAHGGVSSEKHFEEIQNLQSQSDTRVMIWLSGKEKEKENIENMQAGSKGFLPDVWAEGMIIHHGMPKNEDFQWLSTLNL